MQKSKVQKGLAEGWYRSEGVNMLSSSHITDFIDLKTAEPIAATHDRNDSTNGQMENLQEIIVWMVQSDMNWIYLHHCLMAIHGYT